VKIEANVQASVNAGARKIPDSPMKTLLPDNPFRFINLDES